MKPILNGERYSNLESLSHFTRLYLVEDEARRPSMNIEHGKISKSSLHNLCPFYPVRSPISNASSLAATYVRDANTPYN